eukprot:352491-Chlamydomonas_euryale.AAC.1
MERPGRGDLPDVLLPCTSNLKRSRASRPAQTAEPSIPAALAWDSRRPPPNGRALLVRRRGTAGRGLFALLDRSCVTGTARHVMLNMAIVPVGSIPKTQDAAIVMMSEARMGTGLLTLKQAL